MAAEPRPLSLEPVGAQGPEGQSVFVFALFFSMTTDFLLLTFFLALKAANFIPKYVEFRQEEVRYSERTPS